MTFSTVQQALTGLGEEKALKLLNEAIRIRTIARMKKAVWQKMSIVYEGQSVFLCFPPDDPRSDPHPLYRAWLYQGAHGTVVKGKHEDHHTVDTPNKLVFVHFDEAPKDVSDLVPLDFLQPLIPTAFVGNENTASKG